MVLVNVGQVLVDVVAMNAKQTTGEIQTFSVSHATVMTLDQQVLSATVKLVIVYVTKV